MAELPSISGSRLRLLATAAMIRSLIRNPLQLTAVLSLSAAASNVRLSRRYYPLIPTSSFVSSRSAFGYFSSDSETQSSELTRLPTILDGCDYEHWLVVMEAPQRYPLRDEIVRGYIRTLAMVLGSEEEAKKSIYSVSTKYYYAFGCKIAENLAHRIKSLPNVKWVLPDSYLCHGGNGYGGEPFVNGEVVPYDEKYHADWLRDQSDDKCRNKTSSKKARRKRKNKFSKDQDVQPLRDIRYVDRKS